MVFRFSNYWGLFFKKLFPKDHCICLGIDLGLFLSPFLLSLDKNIKLFGLSNQEKKYLQSQRQMWEEETDKKEIKGMLGKVLLDFL